MRANSQSLTNCARRDQLFKWPWFRLSLPPVPDPPKRAEVSRLSSRATREREREREAVTWPSGVIDNARPTPQMEERTIAAGRPALRQAYRCFRYGNSNSAHWRTSHLSISLRCFRTVPPLLLLHSVSLTIFADDVGVRVR
jgi:hypothetical protein